MSTRFRIVFSSACAVLAVMLSLAYGTHVRDEAERVRTEALERYGGEVVTLAVATQQLEPGDATSASNVAMRDWLADLAPEGAVTSMDEALGREVGVASAKGAPLTSLTFRTSSDMAEVPEGRVAVSIPVTDKLGVPRDVPQGSLLAGYVVTPEGTKLISADMVVLAAPAATAVGAAGQLTVAVVAPDVPAVLSASASSDLRLVMPGEGTEDGEGMAGGYAPEELEEGDVAAEATPAEGSRS